MRRASDGPDLQTTGERQRGEEEEAEPDTGAQIGTFETGKRGPDRPPKIATTGIDGLDGILAAVKNSERDRVSMRAALEKIQGVIADVLG